MQSLFERVDTVVLRVKDYRAAEAWYQNQLGLETAFVDEESKYVVMRLAETPITLHELSSGETPVPRGLANSYPILFTKEIEAVHAQLLERGVEVEAMQETVSVRFFDFYDLDGNQLEVCSF